jgi:hypothetical protein
MPYDEAREHLLFKRFGRAIARPGVIVIDTKHPLGNPETAPRVDEEGVGPMKGTAKDVTPHHRLLHFRDPVKHPPVLPGQGEADVLFAKEHGQSSKN